jgi:hypothetical protein
MSEQAAYTEAVISAFEEKMLLLGDAGETAKGKIDTMNASMENAKDAFSDAALAAFDAAGGIDAISESASRLQLLTGAYTALQEAHDKGQISTFQYAQGLSALVFSATHASAVIDNLAGTEGRAFTATKATTEATDGLGHSLVGVTIAFMNAASSAPLMTTEFYNVGRAAGISAELIDAARVALSKYHIINGAMEGLGAKAAAGAVKAKLGLDAVSMSAYSAASAMGSYADVVDEAAERQRAFADAFQTELSTELNIDVDNDELKERQKIIDEGLIGNNGLANMTAINAALYEQAGAAGATAGQLALLGIATGQFTEEQARAALKAAVLQQKIKQMAQAISTGALGYGAAVAGLSEFAGQLDTAGAEATIEDLAMAVDEYATGGPYTADVGADTDTAASRLREIIGLLDDIDGRNVAANVAVNGAPPPPSSPSSPPMPPPPGQPNQPPVPPGPPIEPANVPRNKDNNSRSTAVTVNVTNYVNGQPQRSELDTITEDRIKASLRSLSL